MSTDPQDVLGVILAVVLGATALLDFVRHPRALATTDRLRIPARMVPVLGSVKAAALAGIIVGFGNVRIAEMTGACLVLYFAIATLTHVRARDGVLNAVPAFVLILVSAAYLAAQVAG